MAATIASLLFLVFFLGSLLLWLWMLIDVLSKQEKDKLLWFFVILILGPLGAILYFFIARKKRLAEERLPAIKEDAAGSTGAKGTFAEQSE